MPRESFQGIHEMPAHLPSEMVKAAFEKRRSCGREDNFLTPHLRTGPELWKETGSNERGYGYISEASAPREVPV